MERSKGWWIRLCGIGSFLIGLGWAFLCAWFAFWNDEGEFVEIAIWAWKIVGSSLLLILISLGMAQKRPPLNSMADCLGEVGMFGVVAGICIVLYTSLVELWYNSPWVWASIPGWIVAACGLLLMIGGYIEMHCDGKS